MSSRTKSGICFSPLLGAHSERLSRRVGHGFSWVSPGRGVAPPRPMSTQSLNLPLSRHHKNKTRHCERRRSQNHRLFPRLSRKESLFDPNTTTTRPTPLKKTRVPPARLSLIQFPTLGICQLPTQISLALSPYTCYLVFAFVALVSPFVLKAPQVQLAAFFCFPSRFTAVSGESAKDARLPFKRSPEKECFK
jgi:hypothetical protein